MHVGTEIISSQLELHVGSVIRTPIFLAQYSQAITDLTSGRRELAFSHSL